MIWLLFYNNAKNNDKEKYIINNIIWSDMIENMNYHIMIYIYIYSNY